MKTTNKSSLLRSFSDNESTYAVVGTFINAFGDVKVELTVMKSCSSSLNSSSNYSRINDDSSALSEGAHQNFYLLLGVFLRLDTKLL